MPIKTPFFGLEAFVSGDAFSASVDQRRFRQIDSHLAFIADIIGSGVIDGWTLSESSHLTLNVSSGWGIVDRRVTRTFGNQLKSILDNNTVYLWMKRRSGVVGQVSAFSDMKSFEYSDVSAPDVPSDLSVSSRTTSTISLDWNINSQLDFDVFYVYRSSNNMDFEKIGEASTSDYTDSGLEDNSTYYYKISSVDKSGNESAKCTSISASTLEDTSSPSDPASVEVVASDTAVHFVWRAAAVGSIDHYLVEYEPITAEGISAGDSSSVIVSSTRRYVTISGLLNGQKYKFVLKSVGTNDIESFGITKYATPISQFGPRDVSDISLTDIEGDGTISDIVLSVSWTPFSDPYVSDVAEYYEVQLKEFDGDNGVILSEWIVVRNADEVDIKVFPYLNNGSLVYKSIEERKEYYVTVRSVDADGLKSAGKKAVYSTRCFFKPNPVTMLSVTQLDNQNLEFSWINSTSIFQNNLITVISTNLDNTSLSEDIVVSYDIGKSTKYSITSGIAVNTSYSLSIIVVDEFGNASESKSISFEIPNLSDISNPPVPTRQIGISGDRQATLSWNKAAIEYVSGYRIYRSSERSSYVSGNFERVDTVDSDVYTFTDYGIDNDSVYVYFVTTVDAYGKESLNPIDDGFFDYNLINISPSRTGDMSHPEGLVLSDNGSSGLLLSWQPTGGVFDGYEVYRSINTRSDFEQIATVSPSITYYEDANCLIKNGTYYYLVRKFRNEADLVVVESETDISGAIYIGTVITSSGVMTFDISSVRNLKNLRDPVLEETDSRIADHKHAYYSDVDDRRINLGDSVTVEDWTTSDYQQYFTDTDISDTTTFSVLLNGEKSENVGIFYVLDKDEQRLTFERRLARGNRTNQQISEFPFASPPVVKVVFENLAEVQEILPKERLEGASAQQVSVGLVQSRQIQSINHEGRVRERLVPLQENTIAIDDGFRFAPEDDSVETIGQALVWYDVIFATDSEEDILVGGTSDGIYVSTDFGLTWEKKFETPSPVLKIFYSATNKFYFALTNRGVYGSGGGSAGGFSVWIELPGMENTKIARSITEDGSGYVYCTSDLGVYKLQKDVGRGSFLWQQTPIFGPRSTEAYAILYDTNRDRIIVSNELGIFETLNEGNGWSFSGEMTDQRIAYALCSDGAYLYALTQYMVWRRGPEDTSFQRTSILSDVQMSRNMVIWKNRIYITTDLGLMVSKNGHDIQSDSEIEFVPVFGQIGVNGHVSPPTSLNVIEGKLFVGTEEKLYIAETTGRISLQSSIVKGSIPTVYVNGEELKIGYRFSTNSDRLRKFVYFDEKIPVGSVVTFANQYKKFKVPNGGWVDTDYSSRITMYKDGRKINDGTVIEKPIVSMNALRWPTYNDRNAHKAGADTAFGKVSIALRMLLASEQKDNVTVFTGFDKNNVRISIYSIERFMSQIYVGARIVEELDANGDQVYRDSNGTIVESNASGAEKSFIPFSLPSFTVLLISCDINPEFNGITSFGKYNSLYSGNGGVGSLGSELDDNGSVPGGSTPEGFGSSSTVSSSGSSSGNSSSSGSNSGGSGSGSSGGSLIPPPTGG